MLLHKLFFFLLSLACISSAQPVCSGSGGSVNNAAIRNLNGASAVYYGDHLTLTIVQAYMQPSSRYIHGGVVFNANNAYCFPLRITFTLENGHRHAFTVGGWVPNSRLIIPEIVPSGHVIHVSVETDFGI
jgi:hypothetical protein